MHSQKMSKDKRFQIYFQPLLSGSCRAPKNKGAAMGIVRVQKNSNYSVISNVHLQDDSLSWKAKGILSYLLSKPDSWQIYVSHLKNQSTDGRDATASGIRELIEAGYITRDYSRNEAGQITGRDYVVHEAALDDKTLEKPVNSAENPKTENPSTVKPTTVSPELLNTDYIKDGLKEKNDIQDPSSSSFSKSQKKEAEANVTALMALVPEQFRKPSVRITIERGLKTHNLDYIKLAILYTIQGSDGGIVVKFRAYLAKTIDNGWAEGFLPETAQDTGPDLDAVKNRFEQMPDGVIRLMADAGNKFALNEQASREK